MQEEKQTMLEGTSPRRSTGEAGAAPAGVSWVFVLRKEQEEKGNTMHVGPSHGLLAWQRLLLGALSLHQMAQQAREGRGAGDVFPSGRIRLPGVEGAAPWPGGIVVVAADAWRWCAGRGSHGGRRDGRMGGAAKGGKNVVGCS